MLKPFLRACFWALVLVPLAGYSQIYPDRPVRLVVPFPPGGNIDVVGRLVAESLGPVLGQSVVVDNRPGAGGAVGAESVAKSPPDGYTVLLGSGSTHGTNPAVVKALPYDAVRDFAPVVLIGRYPLVLLANPSLPAQNVQELITLARTSPGKLNFGTYGQGSANHLPVELLKAMTGVEMVHIPYKGAAPALAGLMAGEVQIMFDGLGSSTQFIRSGKVKLLGTGGSKRSPNAPEAATISESGVAGFEAGSFFGLFAPAGTPATTIATLNNAMQKALSAPQLRSRFASFDYEVAGGPPEDLGRLVMAEVAKWRKLIQERNLKFD